MPVFKKRSRSLFESNRFLILFSAFCAIVLWIYVSFNTVQNIEKTFEVPVNINIKNSAVEKMGLGIVDQTEQKVRVTIRGDKFTISRVRTENINATALLSVVTGPGTMMLPITVEPIGSVTNFEIVDTSSFYISVRFDRMTEKPFEVSADVVDLAVGEGMWKESHTPELETVTLSGPETDINKVDKVVARATVKGTLAETTAVDAELIMLDANGDEVKSNHIKKSAETTKVVINILKKKTVTLKVGFSTTPAEYAQTPIKHALDHGTLEIAGPAETIDTLTEIEVGKIDFSKLDQTNNTFSFDLKLPSGVVSINSDITKITATVDTNDLAFKYLSVTVFQTNATSKNITILTTSIANVKIVGKRADINRITGKDLVAYVDVTGQETVTGEVQMPVLISSEKYPSCWAFGSYQASVKI